MNTDTVWTDVRNLVGMSREQTSWLCDGWRTLPKIREFARCFIAGEPYTDFVVESVPLIDVPDGEE